VNKQTHLREQLHQVVEHLDQACWPHQKAVVIQNRVRTAAGILKDVLAELDVPPVETETEEPETPPKKKTNRQ
jgi:hypothetical protein